MFCFTLVLQILAFFYLRGLIRYHFDALNYWRYFTTNGLSFLYFWAFSNVRREGMLQE